MKLDLFLHNGTIRGYVKPEMPDWIKVLPMDLEKRKSDFIKEIKSAKDAALEVENWKEFIYTDYKGLMWFRNVVNHEPLKEGEEIALPESIGWEIIYQEAYISGIGKTWIDCSKDSYCDIKPLNCKRQVIRLKSVEKTTEPPFIYAPILVDGLHGKFDVVEHKTQETLYQKLTRNIIPSHQHGDMVQVQHIARVCNEIEKKANTDTQESQTNNVLKEGIEDLLYSTGRFTPEFASEVTQEILKLVTRKA